MLTDSWNTNVAIDRWSDAEWNSFTPKFKPQIESRFYNRLWLVPSNEWGYVSRGTELCRPNVRCMLNIDVQSSEENAHLVVNCYHVPPGVYLRSSMGPRDGTLSSDAVNPSTNLCGNSQDTLPHEFGHHLGLDTSPTQMPPA